MRAAPDSPAEGGDASHAEPDSAAPFPRMLVAALALSSTLGPLNSTMISVALPTIGTDLGASTKTMTTSLVTSFLVTSVVAQAPSAKFGDRSGHRRALGLGQLLFAAGSIVASLAPSLVVLAGARIAMAIAGALIIPSAAATLRLELPLEKRGRAFGMFGASMALAASIGPFLGGTLVRLATWRSVFLVNLVVLAIAAGLARLERHGSAHVPSPRHAPFDTGGSVLLGLSLTALVIGATASGTTRLLLVATGLLLGAAFVAWEDGQEEPVVDLSLFRERIFVAGGVLIAMHNLAMYGLLFELPGLLTAVLGLGAHDAGPMLACMMVSMVVASPLAGRLMDRFGARVVAGIGTFVSLIGTGIMMTVPLDSTRALVPSLIAFGLGLGLSASPAQAAAMNVAPRDASGAASGVLGTMRYLGGIAGITVLSLLWHGSTERTQALHDHQRSLVVFSAALGIAFACAMMLPRTSSESAPS